MCICINIHTAHLSFPSNGGKSNLTYCTACVTYYIMYVMYSIFSRQWRLDYNSNPLILFLLLAHISEKFRLNTLHSHDINKATNICPLLAHKHQTCLLTLISADIKG